ncbi:MAG TPA: hypothetical protein PK326_11150 [Burkholderiaceae bacterium]|jgi:hypothetical protein|nr:hypothetical protein [Burkholderiaceae bacterium]
MDAEWILATLNDALAQLHETIAAIDGAPEAVEELLPELLPAVYAKLNYAWNSRELGPEALDQLDHDALVAWPEAFPFGRSAG